MRVDLGETLRQVGRGWTRFGCTSLSAAVSYYAALSLFPLLLLVLAAMGWFFESVDQGTDVRDQLLTIISQQFSPWAAEQLEAVLAGLRDAAPRAGPIAVAGLLFGGSLVFNQVDVGFSTIWEVRRPPSPERRWWKSLRTVVFRRVRSMLLIGVVFAVVALVALVGTLLRTFSQMAEEWFPRLDAPTGLQASAIGVTASTLVFGVLYRVLSKQKVGWRLCLASAGVAALLWEAGGWAMGALSMGSRYSAYGVVGSFLVVVLWIHYNAMVFFAGALLVRVRARPLGPE